MLTLEKNAPKIFSQLKHKPTNFKISNFKTKKVLPPSTYLYDPGGGGEALKARLRFYALTHLSLERHYCALGTLQKNSLTPCDEKNNLIGGHDLAVRGVSKYKVQIIFVNMID